jgi:hypothetical protein
VILAVPAARRPAVIAVKAAILMPVLIAVVALAVDAGVLYDRERHAQAAADAAALAAAGDVYLTYANASAADDGRDPNGTAATTARAFAAANGYPDDGTTADVDVHIPPQSGPYANKPGFVEVSVIYHQPRGFSAIFGAGRLRVGARAVARAHSDASGIGILVLDPVGARALYVGGGSIGNVPKADVVVNSASLEAAYGEGSTARLTARAFLITGKASQAGQLVGPMTTGVPPTPDPFRYLPAPDPSTMVARTKTTATKVDKGFGYIDYYLRPGVYDGGLSFDGKSSVFMEPGVYYMRGNATSGGFKFTGNVSTRLQAEGVMIYNDKGTNTVTDPANAAYPNIALAGQSSVNWTPPPTGIYAGMSMFQARGQAITTSIGGGGALTIRGALYSADGQVDIIGSGTSYIGDMFVVYRLLMKGNGTYTVPLEAGPVVPVRDLGLVE